MEFCVSLSLIFILNERVNSFFYFPTGAKNTLKCCNFNVGFSKCQKCLDFSLSAWKKKKKDNPEENQAHSLRLYQKLFSCNLKTFLYQ